jgi:acyl carrier protein
VNDIHERLERVARSVFDDDSLVLSDTTQARDVPAWDSLAHVNFMFGVETEFGVQFTEDEFVGFQDIGELQTILEKKLIAA